MTEKEEQEARAAWNEAAMREMHRRQAEAMAEQQKMQQVRQAMDRQAAMTQQAINETPRQRYACIVAVDERGAFSKDGKIPWSYPEDFKWFQTQTKGHICVMGRTTYDDIINHLGSKSDNSVLPGRKCFVVTSTPLPKNNAIAVASLSEVDKHLSFEDAEQRIVFFCGGERIYSEGIAKSDTVIITVVNKDVEGDRHFPVNYVMKHFQMDKMFKSDSAPDLRFTIWKRNGT